MNLNLKALKPGNGDKIGSIFKGHVIWAWFILAAFLLLYVGYIFHFKIFLVISENPLPNMQIQTTQKNQLNKIIEDLKAREDARKNFNAQNISSPFEIQ